MMINFENIYNFNVIDEIKAGSRVFVIDKFEETIKRASKIEAGILCKILDDKTDRYEFYKKGSE